MPLGSALITDRRLRQVAAADPVLDYPMPDVEALVWSTISHLADDPGAAVTSWSFACTPVPLAGPAGWAWQNSIQIDVRDASKAKAFQRADVARRLVVGLAGQPWPAGVVNKATVIGGPTWLPDYDTGRPRYVTQVLMQVHPTVQGTGAKK